LHIHEQHIKLLAFNIAICEIGIKIIPFDQHARSIL
jgi:hypothetical protein